MVGEVIPSPALSRKETPLDNWVRVDGSASSDEERKAMIAALLRERRGYEIHGDEGGMAAIDRDLKRLGHEAAAPPKRAERRPAPKATTR